MAGDQAAALPLCKIFSYSMPGMWNAKKCCCIAERRIYSFGSIIPGITAYAHVIDICRTSFPLPVLLRSKNYYCITDNSCNYSVYSLHVQNIHSPNISIICRTVLCLRHHPNNPYPMPQQYLRWVLFPSLAAVVMEYQA